MPERVPFERMVGEFKRVLLEAGFAEKRGERCARLFAENTRDGVVSHGLNRFPGFVKSCKSGLVDIGADSRMVNQLGVIEQWDGQGGVGLLNAEACMDRAVEIARAHGMGCVGLRNTNHWMRAGTYGLQAAAEGCIGICWTNTTALMPPWGAIEPKVGNNPLTICVPNGEQHVLLDMAMSQYSNGKLQVLRRRGEALPTPGGYDVDGNLSSDPAAILDSRRGLPVGYWKGSGLALLLDLMATAISGGDSTAAISRRPQESGVSQVFIAIDAASLAGAQLMAEAVDGAVRDFTAAEASEGVDRVRYPGEGMLAIRRENLENGIPVDAELWQQVLEM
jgi:3-dehydro-L-gulonate 2-dehydrogenase